MPNRDIIGLSVSPVFSYLVSFCFAMWYVFMVVLHLVDPQCMTMHP